jgi:hypothetical protein
VRALVLLFGLYLCVMGVITLISKVNDTSFMANTLAYNRNITPPLANPAGYWAYITASYARCGVNGSGGGALGMITAWPLWTFIGTTGGVVVLGVLGILCALFFSRFDMVALFRRFRERSEEHEQKREVERQRRELLKQQKKQEREQGKSNPVPAEKAATLADALATPAYLRAGKGAAPQPVPAGGAAMPYMNGFQPMPGAAQPPQYMQQQLPLMGQPIAQPTPQQPFAQPSQPAAATRPGPAMYEEIIATEAGGTDGAPAIKTPFFKRSATQPVAELAATPMPPTGTGLFGRDRESEKVMRRMEENRKRKEQLDMSMAEFSQAGAADAVLPQSADEAPPQPTAVRRPARQPEQPEMTREQIAYAQQVAAYQAPAKPDTRPAGAAALAAARFEAYKRPSGVETPIGQPPVKIPRQVKTEAGKPVAKVRKPYPYPMIELLNLTTAAIPDTREADRQNALRLEKTLESFDIPARVQRVTHGPAVTRFELGLISSGINVKRIVNIADNIALDMAANGGVRIEVPIPGTNLFGVEIPNKEIISVSLAEVLTSPEMTSAKSPLSVALGKDIAGRPIICDLAKMPHLLIAGQTGSGKSVCINAIINSLLFRATPWRAFPRRRSGSAGHRPPC